MKSSPADSSIQETPSNEETAVLAALFSTVITAQASASPLTLTFTGGGPAARSVTFINGDNNRESRVQFVLPVMPSDRREPGLRIDGMLDDWQPVDRIQNGPLVRMLNRPALQKQILQRADHPSQVYTGWADENFYIATGDSGQGMTHGTIAGILLTDLIQGRKNKWEDLYNPSRMKVKALPEYASENLNVAGQYADYVTAGDISSEDELKPGEGAIMREGISKVAVHRDEGGQLHKRSAVCPHLGCIVAWNSTERTWDCPCHGSRFSAEGRVYQGPANSDLSA